MMISAYLDVLSGFRDEVLGEAVHTLRKTSQFVPTAKELYELCNKLQARDYKDYEESLPKLEAPVEQYSDEYREAMIARFDKLVKNLKNGTLTPKRNGYTEDQLCDESLNINRKGLEPYTMRIRDRHALTVEKKYYSYGYLTPLEAAQPSVRMPIKRTTPPSFRAKWEREHGRPYPGPLPEGDR